MLKLSDRELKKATFLGHERKLEVNISPASIVVSPRLKLIFSTSEKILNNYNVIFNLSSHYHINIVTYLFTGGDDKFKNLGETNVLACQNIRWAQDALSVNINYLSLCVVVFYSIKTDR